jgi:hypothetical protein
LIHASIKAIEISADLSSDRPICLETTSEVWVATSSMFLRTGSLSSTVGVLLIIIVLVKRSKNHFSEYSFLKRR